MALILMPLVTKGEEYKNFFTKGTVWNMTFIYPAPPFTEHEGRYFFDGDTVIASQKGLKLYKENLTTNARSLQTVLRADGDKVFFVPQPGSDEWTLMYDFSLETGKSIEVTPALRWGTSQPSGKPTLIQCQSEGFAEYYEPDFPTLNLMDYNPEDPEGDYRPGVWIKGIGSEGGPMWNAHFRSLGNWEILEKVVSNGQVILTRKESSILGVAPDETHKYVRYHIDGRIFRDGDKGIYVSREGKGVVR